MIIIYQNLTCTFFLSPVTGNHLRTKISQKSPGKRGTQCNKGKGNGLISPVYSINLKTGFKVKRYSSQSKAAALLGIPKHHISLCCRGKMPNAGGFGWQHAFGKMIFHQDDRFPRSNIESL